MKFFYLSLLLYCWQFAPSRPSLSAWPHPLTESPFHLLSWLLHQYFSHSLHLTSACAHLFIAFFCPSSLLPSQLRPVFVLFFSHWHHVSLPFFSVFLSHYLTVILHTSRPFLFTSPSLSLGLFLVTWFCQFITTSPPSVFSLINFFLPCSGLTFLTFTTGTTSFSIRTIDGLFFMYLHTWR